MTFAAAGFCRPNSIRQAQQRGQKISAIAIAQGNMPHKAGNALGLEEIFAPREGANQMRP